MPSSRHDQITKIVDIIIALRPTILLDVGVGFGKYGVLAREYLELWVNDRNYEKKDWVCRIDGIEAYAKFITPMHEYVYDNIYIGDAGDIIPTLRDVEYDLVLLIDVLEHFDTENGVTLLNNLLEIAKGIIVCVPKVFREQEAVLGNPYEKHRAQWDKADFRRYWKCAFIPDRNKNIAIIGDQSIGLWKDHRINKLKGYVKRKLLFLRN